MANHKLSDSVKTDMTNVATGLVKRRLNQMEAGFPLSVNQVQACVLPARWRNIAPQMHADGFAVPRDSRPRVKITHPQITRGAEVQLSMKQAVLVPTSYGAIGFYLDTLDDETIQNLAKWVNRAVDERRLASLINRVVRDFIDRHADTTGHVQARWPQLVMLADRMTDRISDSRYLSEHAKERILSWKEKFHERPKSMLRYRWQTPAELDWAKRHDKAMKLASATLAGALMLPTSTPAAPIEAHVASWTALPTDPDRKV